MQNEIHAGLLVDLQHNICFLGNSKTLRLHLHGVRGRPQAGEKIFAVFVGLRRLRHIGADVRDRDRGVGQHGAARVRYRAADLRLIRALSHGRRNREQRGQRD